MSSTERAEWRHLGNTAAHYEDFECTGCGRHTSISNRSDRFQEAGEPEPCQCDVDTDGDQND